MSDNDSIDFITPHEPVAPHQPVVPHEPIVPNELMTPHEPVVPPSVNDRADIPSTFIPRIGFFHPSYPLGEPYLLRLPAFDDHQGGLQHAVALDCLTIIAANAVGGYLARTRDGPAIDLPRYGVLREAEYYFIVPNPARDGKFFFLLSPVDGSRVT